MDQGSAHQAVRYARIIENASFWDESEAFVKSDSLELCSQDRFL
jgi:hypothetical protein